LDPAQVAQKAQHAGAHIGVKPLAKGKDHIIGGEFIAIVESHTLAEIERPGLDIITGLPAIQQVGAGDVVGADFGQIFVHLADDIAALDPRQARRVIDALE
jgi:hypothetical protein